MKQPRLSQRHLDVGMGGLLLHSGPTRSEARHCGTKVQGRGKPRGARVFRVCIAAVIALMTLVVPSAFDVRTAKAEEPQPAIHVEPALRNCVSYAVKHALEQWVCTGSGVTYESKDASGKTRQRFVAIVQSRPRLSQGVTIKASDDYDSWCEYSGVCHRKISNYIEEVKGNAAYGNQNGAIGSFDIVVRTNLNGRQAQWRVTYIWDSGPSIKFEHPQISCWDKEPITGVWYGCGSYVVSNGSTAPKVSPSSWRWNSSWLYSARLERDDTYHGAHDTYFVPSGYPRYAASVLNTGDFNCFSNGTCKF